MDIGLYVHFRSLDPICCATECNTGINEGDCSTISSLLFITYSLCLVDPSCALSVKLSLMPVEFLSMTRAIPSHQALPSAAFLLFQ